MSIGRRSILAAMAVLALAAAAPAGSAAPWDRKPAAPPSGLPAASPESMGFSSERLQRLHAGMDAAVDAGLAPGIATVVIRHGRIVDTHVYGKADLASGAPLTRETIWRMYSQTKPVTGVAMMILYEEGRWRLDEPVTKYVPEFEGLKVFKGLDADGRPTFEPIARSATMRELMTHTAGFAYGLMADNYVDKAYQDSRELFGAPSLGQAMQALAGLPLAGQPGEAWRYSVAVDVQGYIVEKLSGQTLPDFMQSRIFGPLGMKDTAFWVPPEKAGRLASLYMIDPKTRSLAPAEGFMVLPLDRIPAAANGGGGLVSTMADFARFGAMLANGGALDGTRILSPATVKLMASNHLSDITLATYQAGNPGRGFGLDVDVILDPAQAGTLAGKGSFSWGGAAGTWFWVDPENDVVVLGFIHVLGGSRYRLDERSATLVYQALVDPSR
ncbi:MAG: serine hydrolase domain-containing protein [Pseudomonadota bacterium]